GSGSSGSCGSTSSRSPPPSPPRAATRRRVRSTPCRRSSGTAPCGGRCWRCGACSGATPGAGTATTRRGGSRSRARRRPRRRPLRPLLEEGEHGGLLGREEGGRVPGVAPPEVLQQRALAVGVYHVGVDVVLPAHGDGVAETGGDLLDGLYDGL